MSDDQKDKLILILGKANTDYRKRAQDYDKKIFQ